MSVRPSAEAASIKCDGRESAGLLALAVRDSIGLPVLSIGESVGLPADHVVLEHFIGRQWNLRQKLYALRCCMDPGGTKSQFSSNSNDIKILLHCNLVTLHF